MTKQILKFITYNQAGFLCVFEHCWWYIESSAHTMREAYVQKGICVPWARSYFYRRKQFLPSTLPAGQSLDWTYHWFAPLEARAYPKEELNSSWNYFVETCKTHGTRTMIMVLESHAFASVDAEGWLACRLFVMNGCEAILQQNAIYKPQYVGSEKTKR